MQQNQMCSICEQQPEEMLILSCQHNLCVNCATEVFTINQKSNPFTCEICLNETQLDKETIEQLLQLTQRKTLNKPPKSQKPSQSKPKYSSSVCNQSEVLVCKIHNQQSLYFCFNCITADICSQCILTTKHSGHKVVTIKKAIGSINKQIDEKIKEKQILKNQLSAEKSKYISAYEQTEGEIEDKKNQLKQIYEEIIGNIQEYFKELNSKIEIEASRVQEILQGSIGEIQEKINMLDETINYDRNYSKCKNEQQLLKLHQRIGQQNFEMFYPRLPSQIPFLELSIRGYQSVNQSIEKILSRIVIDQEDALINTDSRYRNSFECSVIRPEIIDYANDEEINNVLQQSQKQRIMYGNNSFHHKEHKGWNNNRNSRKLEMSRSIDNATNIINKLQQRSRNG